MKGWIVKKVLFLFFTFSFLYAHGMEGVFEMSSESEEEHDEIIIPKLPYRVFTSNRGSISGKTEKLISQKANSIPTIISEIRSQEEAYAPCPLDVFFTGSDLLQLKNIPEEITQEVRVLKKIKGLKLEIPNLPIQSITYQTLQKIIKQRIMLTVIKYNDR